MAESAVILGQLFNGVSVASILLLAALGLVLTFGLMHVINMAHGEMLMVGGYLSYLTLKAVHGPFAFLACLLVAFLGAAALVAESPVPTHSVRDPRQRRMHRRRSVPVVS